MFSGVRERAHWEQMDQLTLPRVNLPLVINIYSCFKDTLYQVHLRLL